MRKKGKMKHWDFMVLDAAMLMLSYVLAWFLRFDRSDQAGFFKNQLILVLLAFAAVNLFDNPLKNVLKRGKLIEFRKTLWFTIELALFDIVCLFLIHEANSISRLFFGYLWVIDFILTYFTRLVFKQCLQKIGQNLNGKGPAILIASSQNAQGIVADYEKTVFKTYSIAAVFLTDYRKGESPKRIHGIEVKGGLEEAVDYATHNWVDEAMLSMPEDYEHCEALADMFCTMGIKVHMFAARIRKSSDDLNVQYAEKLGDYVVITQVQRVVRWYQWALKRTMDIIGGIVGCMVTAILFLFVAPAIYHKDPGPIFYAAPRVGKNGKLFKMYKFRSMYMDADERKKELMAQNKMSGGMMFKIDDDPRIIGSEKKDKNGKSKGIGNFIRETSIDEFPQFWSVLIGDMSLCGTRPPTPDEYEKYSARHKARLALRPGISGLWQVSGRSSITDFDEIVELDTEYIRTWNFWLDVKILAKTVGAVLRHDGAE